MTPACNPRSRTSQILLNAHPKPWMKFRKGIDLVGCSKRLATVKSVGFKYLVAGSGIRFEERGDKRHPRPVEPNRRAINFVKGEDGGELAELPGLRTSFDSSRLSRARRQKASIQIDSLQCPSTSQELFAACLPEPNCHASLEPRRPLAKWLRGTDDEICHSP